jgi:GNAT superfamily N-acetyltransferase
VRRATHGDLAAVAAGVRELLLELGGTPPETPAMQASARTLIDSPAAGMLLLAEVADELVGVLAASCQTAMHVPGPYVLIQDLWVRDCWRGREVGSDLLAAVFELARERRIERVEVGLPRENFARFGSTEAFYLHNGFTHLGPRMRRILA